VSRLSLHIYRYEHNAWFTIPVLHTTLATSGLRALIMTAAFTAFTGIFAPAITPGRRKFVAMSAKQTSATHARARATRMCAISDLPDGRDKPSGDYKDGSDGGSADGGEVDMDEVEGLMENANVRPMLDIDADERALLLRLRMSLHPDDYKRIFNQNDRRIGEVM
jgi:hypothetical protein